MIRDATPSLATPSFSPLYQQIKALITQRLQSGEWKPGELIPSEVELAARFKVSQGTVRKAIDDLAASNLLVRRQGKGTFVAEPKITESLAQRLTGFYEDMASRGNPPVSRVLKQQLTSAVEKVETSGRCVQSKRETERPPPD